MRQATDAGQFRRGRHGQVLVVVLLAVALLAGLVFYVYNLGDKVNRRLELQSAADATAISGSTWMARSMNVIAMNNVGQAKMVSAVPILDAMPDATAMAAYETGVWEQIIAEQLRRGIPSLNGAGGLVREGLENLHARMLTQHAILVPVAARLNASGFDMRDVTFWYIEGASGAPPHGRLWQAAASMDEFSQAVLETAGVLAQADAVQYGRASHAETAFLVPVWPELPGVRGTYADLQWPIEGRLRVDDNSVEVQRSGGRGGAIPDAVYPYRLGPYARLHRWRDEIRQATDWAWIPPSGGGSTRGGGGAAPGGRRTGGSARTSNEQHGGYWSATDWDVLGYHAYGPYSWAMRHLDWYANDHFGRDASGSWWYREGALADTFFYRYVRDLARMKRGYLFTPDPPLGEYHWPEWVWPYPVCRQIGQADEIPVHQTLVYVVEIASKYPDTDSRWLTSGTFRTNGDRPMALWISGWSDPAEWRGEGNQPLPRMSEWIWRDRYDYETTEDNEIGIHRQVDALTGEDIWQPVYMTTFYIFGGIDIGEKFVVRNPANYHPDDVLPAPILLDTRDGDYDPYVNDPDGGIRRERFAFLGVARRHDRSAIWPERFAPAGPAGGMYAVAQAELFNSSSWDLWTQDWQVRLKQVVDWEDWMARMSIGAPDADLLGTPLGSDEVRDAHDYLYRISPRLAEMFLQH